MSPASGDWYRMRLGAGKGYLYLHSVAPRPELWVVWAGAFKVGYVERDEEGRWQARLEPSHAGLQRDADQLLAFLLDNPEPYKADPPDLRRRRPRDDEPRLF